MHFPTIRKKKKEKRKFGAPQTFDFFGAPRKTTPLPQGRSETGGRGRDTKGGGFLKAWILKIDLDSIFKEKGGSILKPPRKACTHELLVVI